MSKSTPMMEATQAHGTSPAAVAATGPRLVLITADEPEGAAKPSPDDVVGTGQHVVGSGGFCLTDR